MCDRLLSSVINKLVSCNDYVLRLWTRWFWFWCWFQAVSEEFYRPWCCTEVLCITWQVWWVYWLLTDVLISVVSYVLILLNCNLNLPPDVCVAHEVISEWFTADVSTWVGSVETTHQQPIGSDHQSRTWLSLLWWRADQCSDKLLNMLKFLDLSL